METCDKHNDLTNSLARIEERVIALDKRINGSYDMFLDHVRQGKAWRGVLVGLAVTLCLNIIGFAYLFGTLSKTVCVNERTIVKFLDSQMGKK